MTESKQRVVKNRYHYFVKREFSAAKRNTTWEIPINVPFAVDDLVVRDVANSEANYTTELLERKDTGITALAAIPRTYIYLLSMDEIGTLCSFTERCYIKLDSTFKLDGRYISGQQTFRLSGSSDEIPLGGGNIDAYFVCHLEFISYEK